MSCPRNGMYLAGGSAPLDFQGASEAPTPEPSRYLTAPLTSLRDLLPNR